jgi:hypothetical protein
MDESQKRRHVYVYSRGLVQFPACAKDRSLWFAFRQTRRDLESV